MASNSNCREVCVEVYVNGELYCFDSVGVPDEENVQMEFMVTERIYELLGCSPGDITARLEVDTDKCISVSRAALEGEDVQIDVDVKQLTCTTHENSPTESTTEWVKRKMSGFFQTIFWMDPAVPERTPEKDRVPEANLVTVRWPGEEPGNKKISPKRVMKKMSAVFKKYFPLDPAEPSCDPETEPVSAEGQEDDIRNGMDASPGTAEMNGPRESTIEWAMRKMSGFFQMIFWMDPAVPERTPEKDRVPEANLVGVSRPGSSSEIEKISPKRESAKKKKMSAFFKKYFPLDQAGPSCDPESE